MHAIINGRIVLNDKTLDGCALLFDKKIIGIVSRETLDTAWQNEKCWQGKPLTLTDAKGAYVSPGFINLHIHGCNGADTMDGTEDTLAVMSRFLAQTGVTAFLPTTMTCAMPALHTALERVRENVTVMIRRREEKHEAQLTVPDSEKETFTVKNNAGKLLTERAVTGRYASPDVKTEGERSLLPGAKVLGAYVEGPFISSVYKGAQKIEHVLPADFALLKDFADVIKVVVLAPETLEQDPEGLRYFIEQCRQRHIIVSLGHSGADYDTARQAIEAGASHVTHLCNAMTGLHHRKPGLLGAALDSSVMCELIADNLHVHPAMQRLIYRTKGAAGIELITDSMRACGLPDGISELGGQTVYVKNGAARLEDGTIAGSVVTLNRAMANFRENTGATVPEVVRTVTENPAQELGLFEKIGSLSPGATADVTVFDEDFTILHTFVDGLEVYRSLAIR